ncbi:hypothetical protein BCR32DRAFT_247394 [Anaeromyces robustus]|uniref:Uncharacterized protein n=1 Tax=Anaeromyces robustus TaxID=1754192 RepID=A0A1Y1WXB5_9FUNG|nr:hypothetical protein BCR32DRAFT_247394 [Anaeromyces robustus]|eukprot:ORX78153.1 hypothetical protein BCR32DRAFT_247394 [Anaeromyces robustus]
MDETEIKNMNQLIEIAKSKKPCSRDTFLITLAINIIEKEKKKSMTSSNRIREITNTSIEYRQLKSSAIELHVKALSEIKVLLKSLRTSANRKDTLFYIDCIKNLSNYETKCNIKYNKLITKYDKTKNILHLYVIFIVDIMDRNLYNECIKTYCEIERNNSEFKHSITNLNNDRKKKASEANLRDLKDDENSKDLPYQLKKLGSMIDQSSIMTLGVINNIKKISGEFVRKPSMEMRRSSLDIRRSSLDIRRSSVDIKRSSIDMRRSSIDMRRSSSEFKSPTENYRKSSNEINKKVTYNNNIKSLNNNNRYRHFSQQLLPVTTPSINMNRFSKDTNDINASLHSILRHPTVNEEETPVKSSSHVKRLSITFNPIVESNIYMNDIVNEEDEEIEDSSTSSSEYVDEIKPLNKSYGITEPQYKESPDSNDPSLQQSTLNNNVKKDDPKPTSSSVSLSHTPMPPRRRSVFDMKKKNSISNIVQIYTDQNEIDKSKIEENKNDDSNEFDDIVPEMLKKPKNSFLNENYKIEVQQRRRLSELNRRRSMYSNGRLSISHNLKSSDSLNDEIDTFHINHSDFTKIVELRNRMKNRFTSPFKKYTSRMKCFLILLILATTFNFVINLLLYTDIVNILPRMRINIQSYWLSSTLTLKTRLTSIAFMGKNENLYNDIIPLNDYINTELDDLLVDELLSFSTDTLTKNSILYGKSNDTIDAMIIHPSILMKTIFLILITENNKDTFKVIFEESMSSFVNKMNSKCVLQEILTLTSMTFILFEFFYLIAFVLKPIIKYTISTETKSLTMFGKIPKSCIDEMIKKYENQIEFLAENFDDDDVNESQNDDNDDNNKKNKNKDIAMINDNELTSFTSQHPSFWTYVYFIIGILIIAIPTFIIFIPVMSFKPELINNMNYQINTAKKGYYMNQLILYSYEQFFNDEYTYGRYETRRKLNEYLNLLEEVNDELQEIGSKATITSDYNLNYISNEQGCVRKSVYMEECEKRIYDSTYGYTEEIANVPYNLKMNEYLAVIKRFIRDISDFKPEGNFFNKNDLNSQINNAINNKFIKYEKALKDDIFGAIYRINEIFLEYIYSFINRCVLQVFLIYFVSLLAMFICYKFIFKKVTTAKEKELEYLSYFVFTVPQFYVKNNETYSRFLETGQVEED